MVASSTGEMKTKGFTLLSGSLEGWHWSIVIAVSDKEQFTNEGFRFSNEKELGKRDRRKRSIRTKDKSWIVWNIPSSIWWYMEVHHDWKDGARMYLLTKGEHILRHRKE